MTPAGDPIGPGIRRSGRSERSQQLSRGRQPGIEVSPELVGRLPALRPGDLGEYLVEVARPHLACSWLDRGAEPPSRHGREGGGAARRGTAPSGGRPLTGGPPNPSVTF